MLKSGAADAKRPGADTPCECHYRGWLIDGREFDSSHAGAPATFAPAEVIKGWTEALLAMREGDLWQLFVPSELAYGDSSRWRRVLYCLLRLISLTVCAGAASSLPVQCSFLSSSCFGYSHNKQGRATATIFMPVPVTSQALRKPALRTGRTRLCNTVTGTGLRAGSTSTQLQIGSEFIVNESLHRSCDSHLFRFVIQQ